MADLNQYPEEHPETGKVKNPLTGNWVKKSYAKGEGILEQAKEYTQQYFKEEREDNDSDDIDQLLQEADDVELGEAFNIDDEDLERLDERADINHPEIPDSEFPDEEGFDPNQEPAEPQNFQQPPTPEGFEEAAQQQQGSGEYKGVYSGQGAGQSARQEARDSQKQGLEKKHEEDEVRYVKTEQGGMKMVYPNEQNDDE